MTLIANVPMTEEMRKVGREQALRTRLVLATNDLIEAAEWRARAEAKVKATQTKLEAILDEALRPAQPSSNSHPEKKP